jgi:trimeric autotransporter adhesin
MFSHVPDIISDKMKLRISILVFFVAIYLSSCKKDAVTPAINQSQDSQNLTAASTGLNQGSVTNIITGYLRLQLAKDVINTDNIIIDFKAGSKTTYVKGEDAPTLQGFGMVSLSSLSSDNEPLAINILPLPTQSLTIGLKVKAKTEGIYNLSMTTISSIPDIFEIWLMDSYKKDSLDFRVNSSYAFNIFNSDTSSYGGHRFSLVVRQNKAIGVHLLNFTATKTTEGTQVVWITELEKNYTSFTVERSTDNGQTYNSLTSFISSETSTYSFLDKTPVSGIDLYRLKLQDLNGTVIYSTPISLNY